MGDDYHVEPLGEHTHTHACTHKHTHIHTQTHTHTQPNLILLKGIVNRRLTVPVHIHMYTWYIQSPSLERFYAIIMYIKYIIELPLWVQLQPCK